MYYDYHTDNDGNVTCIHHYFYYDLIFDYLKELAGNEYDLDFKYGCNATMAKYYQKHATVGITPKPIYYADLICVEKMKKPETT